MAVPVSSCSELRPALQSCQKPSGSTPFVSWGFHFMTGVPIGKRLSPGLQTGRSSTLCYRHYHHHHQLSITSFFGRWDRKWKLKREGWNEKRSPVPAQFLCPRPHAPTPLFSFYPWSQFQQPNKGTCPNKMTPRGRFTATPKKRKEQASRCS